ncbi:MAG: hypothetical protein JXB46_02950 [Candidatus Eisenbacteria bacterium]|nr:hypothetical protein [Candidatus Eisenbacteria bacterium]
MAGEVGIWFVVIGGPHDGARENPTCYARTTQRQKYIRWTKPRVSKRTGKILPARLTQWGRYQDYIEHVRNSVFPMSARKILWNDIWPRLHLKDCMFVVDLFVQFRGGRHSDPDHVASTIADALFPKPPNPSATRSRASYDPVWPIDTLVHSPGDRFVIPRIIDCRDQADTAFVGVHIHGPYERGAWLFPDLAAPYEDAAHSRAYR